MTMTKDQMMDPNVIGSWLSATIKPLVSTRAQVTTSATIGTSSVLIIGTNPNRLGFMLYNNSANSGYFTYGDKSVSNSCSFMVATFANFTWATPINYTGPIACVRNAGTGTVVVTELLA